MFELNLGCHWIGPMKRNTSLQAESLQKFFINKPIHKHKIYSHSGYYNS